MGVQGGVAVTMVNDHILTVGGVPARGNDLAAPGRLYRGAVGRRDVNAGVAVGPAGDGMDAVAEGGGQLVVAGQGPGVARTRIQHHVVLPPLLLHLLLLFGDVGVELGNGGVFGVQRLIDLFSAGIDLIQQLLGLGHLFLLFGPDGLLFGTDGLLIGLALLQLGLDGLDLAAGLHQLVHHSVVVLHDLVDIGDAAEQVGKTLRGEEHRPVGHVPVLLHGPHPLAEELILLLLPGHRLHPLGLLLGDLAVVVADLRINIVDLIGDGVELLL